MFKQQPREPDEQVPILNSLRWRPIVYAVLFHAF